MSNDPIKPCKQCGKCCTFPNASDALGMCDIRHWLPPNPPFGQKFTGRCVQLTDDNQCKVIAAALDPAAAKLFHPAGVDFVKSIIRGVCTLDKPGKAAWVLSPEGKRAMSRKFMEQAIDRLNTMIAVDPIAMETLVGKRGPMLKSAAASKDPKLETLTVALPGMDGCNTHTLSILGLLNLSLRDAPADPVVTAVWSEAGPTSKLTHFELSNPADVVWVAEEDDASKAGTAAQEEAHADS